MVKTLPNFDEASVAISRKSSITRVFAPTHYQSGRTGGKRKAAIFALNVMMINTLSG